jgi:hypothetical protein
MHFSPELTQKIEQLIAHFKIEIPEPDKVQSVPVNMPEYNLEYNWLACMTREEDKILNECVEALKKAHPHKKIGKCIFMRYIALHYLKNKEKIDLTETFAEEAKRRKATHYNWRKKRD